MAAAAVQVEDRHGQGLSDALPFVDAIRDLKYSARGSYRALGDLWVAKKMLPPGI